MQKPRLDLARIDLLRYYNQIDAKLISSSKIVSEGVSSPDGETSEEVEKHFDELK